MGKRFILGVSLSVTFLFVDFIGHDLAGSLSVEYAYPRNPTKAPWVVCHFDCDHGSQRTDAVDPTRDHEPNKSGKDRPRVQSVSRSYDGRPCRSFTRVCKP